MADRRTAKRLILPLLLAFAPSAARADTCDTIRPAWDGNPVTGFGELMFLLQTPIVLALILTTALALRFRNQWFGLVVVLGWSMATYFLTGGDLHTAAMAEGCAGPTTLFIVAVFALCAAIVLYTAPLKKRD